MGRKRGKRGLVVCIAWLHKCNSSSSNQETRKMPLKYIKETRPYGMLHIRIGRRFWLKIIWFNSRKEWIKIQNMHHLFFHHRIKFSKRNQDWFLQQTSVVSSWLINNNHHQGITNIWTIDPLIKPHKTNLNSQERLKIIWTRPRLFWAPIQVGEILEILQIHLLLFNN